MCIKHVHQVALCIFQKMQWEQIIYYEKVYMELYKVADTLFHIQGDEMYYLCSPNPCKFLQTKFMKL